MRDRGLAKVFSGVHDDLFVGPQRPPSLQRCSVPELKLLKEGTRNLRENVLVSRDLQQAAFSSLTMKLRKYALPVREELASAEWMTDAGVKFGGFLPRLVNHRPGHATIQESTHEFDLNEIQKAESQFVINIRQLW